MLFSRPITLTAALQNSLAKRVLAVVESVGSAELQSLPAAVRDGAFFSARTPFVEYLAEFGNLVTRMIQPDVRVVDGQAVAAGAGQSVSPAQVRARMKQYLASIGYRPDPAEAGGLRDLSSDRRINLIIDTQLSMQRGKGSWLASQAPEVLELFPADELYRAIHPRIQGRDWQTRWNDARADLGDATSATYAETPVGPFVARKNDPIWSSISRFGNPYPPFDYNSGMRVRDVGRRRAVALGVVDPDEQVAPAENPQAVPQEISLASVPDELRAAVRDAFGPRASVNGDRLTLSPAAEVA